MKFILYCFLIFVFTSNKIELNDIDIKKVNKSILANDQTQNKLIKLVEQKPLCVDSNNNGLYYLKYTYKGSKHSVGDSYISFPVIFLNELWYVKINDTLELSSSVNNILTLNNLKLYISNDSLSDYIYNNYSKGPVYSREAIVHFKN